MNKILALREKRANLWNETKAFLDSHRGEDGMISAEDNATYEKMEANVVALGKEIERLERQAAIDRELDQPTASPLVSRPTTTTDRKQGRASDEYRNAFWGMIRNRTAAPSVMNALQIGTDTEGGFLVPDEYERTLVQALEEENVLRSLCTIIQTSSGDRKIPVMASHGTASWVDEEGAIPESDEVFGKITIGAHKVATMIKVSDELGLKWGDFDFTEDQVHIQRDLDYACSVAQDGSLKTDAADRYVPIPPELKEKLLPNKGGADEYVFHTEKGKPLPHATFKRMWHRLMLAAGCVVWREVKPGTSRPDDILKQIKVTLTPHYFRHNYVTMLYESGIDPLVAMKIVGHTDYQTTANIYTHIKEEMLKKATVDLEGVFKKRAGKE